MDGLNNWGLSVSDSTLESFCPSIDWLTFTATKEANRPGLWNLGRELVRLSAKDGNDERPWRWRDYSGFHAGEATVGRREDSDILQLSGYLADSWFDKAWLTSDHCTRLDLAVTVWGGGNLGNLAQRHNAEVSQWKRENNRTLGAKLIYDNDYANTLYLGSRESDLFGRIYDKFVESGDPAFKGAWRYELELKGDPAQRGAGRLHSAGNRPDRIRSAVFQHFARRGVQPVFSSVGTDLPIRTHRAPSDSATRLSWLATAVRPAVQRLCIAGHYEAVLDALGIPRSIGERYRLRLWLDMGGHTNQVEGESDET